MVGFEWPAASNRLVVKLISVTILFMGLLLVAIVVTTQVGLRQTEQSAAQRSAEGLRAQGSASLLQLASREAQLSNVQLLQAAHISEIAAEYMAAAQAVRSAESGEELSEGPGGVRYDANPERATDIYVPNFAATHPLVDQRLRDSSVLNALFPSLLGKVPDVVAHYYVSPEGLTRYAPPVQLHTIVGPDLNVPAQPTFLVAAPENNPDRRTAWTAPYIDDAENGPLVTASTPVYFGDEFQGSISVDIALSRLIARLEALRPSPSGYSFLIDEENRLVAAPEEAVESLFGQTPHSDTGLGAFGRDLAEVTNLPLADALQVALGSESALFGFTERGEDHFLVHAPLRDLGWSLVLVAPVDELTAQKASVASAIQEDARQTLQLTMLVIGGFFTVAVAGVVMTSRWMTQPIAALVAGTQRVAHGDLDVTLPIRTSDELGTLARSFNQMTMELRAAQERLEERNHALEAAQIHLERRVEERTTELTSLLEVSRSISSTLQLEPLLSLILQQLKRVIPDEGSALYLREEGDRLSLTLYQGPLSGEPLPASWSLAPPQEEHTPLAELVEVAAQSERGFGREVIYSGAPVIIDDVRDDTLLARAYRMRVSALTNGEVPPLVGTWMGVPLLYRGQVIGMIGFDHGQPGYYTERHASLALAFANHAAIAIENARLYEQAQELASLRERQKLARELHDSVSQALYGIGLGARTARAQLDLNPEKAIAPLDYVLSLAKAGMAEMRALIFELRPEALAEEGLVAALSKQAESLRARHQIQVVADLGEEPDVPYPIKEAIYRVAQEAMHNTLKHAGASEVRLSLFHDGDWLCLDLRDNGRGFDASGSYPGHLGLKSMRERVERLGGQLNIESAPGVGTSLQARVAAPSRT